MAIVQPVKKIREIIEQPGLAKERRRVVDEETAKLPLPVDDGVNG